MVRPSPKNERKLRWFSRLVLANCVVGTAVSALVIGPESWMLAALMGGAFWLAYALITIRTMKQQLDLAKQALDYHAEVPESVDHETGLINARAFQDS